MTDLAAIEAKIAKLQTEISRVPIAATAPPKRKPASLESIRPDDENAISTILEDNTAASTQPTATQLAKRKRKPGSVLSAASGPAKYRSRTMIVLMYDGDVQKMFEDVVKCIGTGRNLLRKGKMAAKMDALADMANMLDDEADEEDTTSKIGFKPRVHGLPNFRSTRHMAGPRGPAESSGEKYDVADKALEKAQSLCERGAHQFLRDGDCRKELNGMKEQFAEVVRLSELYMTKKLTPSQEDLAMDVVQEETKHVDVPAPLPPLAAKTIEVDDDDGEEWVMPPIRRTIRT